MSRKAAYGKNLELHQQHYEKVILLRGEGYGYGTIAKQLSIPSHLVRHWSQHIKVDKSAAIQLGMKTHEFDDVSSTAAKKIVLIRERGHQCEGCRLTEWFGNPIPLELHNHRKPKNQCLLLCPNCHALTDDWRGRGKVRKP